MHRNGPHGIALRYGRRKRRAEHGGAWQLPADASDGSPDARRRIADVKVGNADEGHSLTAELKLVT